MNMKLGIKTNEFWATLTGSIASAVASELRLKVNEASFASSIAMVITYVVVCVMNKNTKLKLIRSLNHLMYLM